MSLLKLTGESSSELERDSVVVAIPVFEGYDHVVESVTAALLHTAPEVPICIINDGSSDPRISEFIEELGSSPELEHQLYLIDHPENLGFVESCNEVFAHFAPADVVVLNSDCVVSAGWLSRMQAAAAGDPRIATVSVLANSATIISVPERNKPTAELPQGSTLAQAAERVAGVSAKDRPEIPTAIGHCMLIRRPALELVGDFDTIFSPGYGEEVDFSQRCLILGLKHVVASDVYVFHHGGVSFAERKSELQESRDQITAKRYPWFLQSVHDSSSRTEGPLDNALLSASLALRPMRVTVDGACLGSANTGTQTHTLGVISALAGNSRIELRILVPANLDSKVASRIAGFGPSELLCLDDVDEQTEKSDIVHRPFQVTKPSDMSFLSALGHRVVVSQLDQIAFHNPSYFDTAAEWLEYRQTTIDALANVDLAVFISQHSADDAIQSGLISPDRAEVIHLGVDHLLSGETVDPLQPAQLADLVSKPFLLCLGTNFSHKNRPFAIRLLTALRKCGWDGRLVLAGPHAASGTSEAAERKELQADANAAENVLDLGAVGEDEKSWLMENAAAVLYPTTHEGFGFVPFEAAAAGAPCLFASHTSLAELLPADLATITPWNADQSTREVLPLLVPGTQRDDHVNTIREIGSRLTWDGYAERLLTAYDKVLKRPSSSFSLVTRRGQGAVSREGYWLVGPDGLLDQRYERPLLAISSRPALAFFLLRPIEYGYRAGFWIGRKLRPISTGDRV
jgi:GT2 family glycosyltransferase/glycosyltransferase involved in cell wall biosynthesis